jgi:hypothetical protein
MSGNPPRSILRDLAPARGDPDRIHDSYALTGLVKAPLEFCQFPPVFERARGQPICSLLSRRHGSGEVSPQPSPFNQSSERRRTRRGRWSTSAATSHDKEFATMKCLVSIAACAFAMSLAAGAAAQQGPDHVSATLVGPQETPAVSTPAQGSLEADIDDANRSVDWTLSFSGLQGQVTQAHIHFAQPNVAGGIVLWFCKTAATAANAPAGTKDCPTPGGTVSGTFTPADVRAVTTQGISPGDFEEVVWAMRNGFAYANVHSDLSPGGEIRGQIQAGAGH